MADGQLTQHSSRRPIFNLPALVQSEQVISSRQHNPRNLPTWFPNLNRSNLPDEWHLQPSHRHLSLARPTKHLMPIYQQNPTSQLNPKNNRNIQSIFRRHFR